MLSSFSFELSKLRKRPATWVLGLIFIFLFVVLSAYFLFYFSIQQQGNGGFQSLYPKNTVHVVLSVFGDFGATIAVILGALVAGNEYGENTLKTVLTQRPGRVAYLVGKLLAMFVVLAVFTVASFLAGAICGYIVAALQPTTGSMQAPPAGEVLTGLGAGWFILACFGSVGFSLAVLFRSTALALGIGMGYFAVGEGLLGVVATGNTALDAVYRYLPSRNATDLADSFGTRTYVLQHNPVTPAHAVTVLMVYGIIFILLAMFLFRKRDII